MSANQAVASRNQGLNDGNLDPWTVLAAANSGRFAKASRPSETEARRFEAAATKRVKLWLTLMSLQVFPNHGLLSDGSKASDGAKPFLDFGMTDALDQMLTAGYSPADRVRAHARLLSGQMRSLSAALFPPSASKGLRQFTSGEVAKTVGVSDGYLRQLSLDGLGPKPGSLPGGNRRLYTLAQVNELRGYLAEARPREALQFKPGRRDSEKLQILTVANFKGGSAKTTTALYLSQYLALRGFRVLAIDLDPQASLPPCSDISRNSTSQRTRLSTVRSATTARGGQCETWCALPISKASA